MEKRIKIMFVAQAYPGGVPVYIEELVKHLDKVKFDCILVCSQAYEEERFAPYFSAIEKVGMERSISVSKILKPAWETRKLIKKYKPDVVYCNSSIAGAVGRLAAIGCGAKVLYNAHSWAFNMRISNKKTLFYRWIEKFFALFTDTIICVSNYEKTSALQNHICKPKKLQVILNGVDIEQIEKRIANSKLTRVSLKIPENAYVVGMVGRISEQKAPDIFVKAARKVKDVVPNAFFMIVGDGPDQEEIEKMISDLDLKDSFLITGWTKQAIEYLALFDVAVLCSRWEGLPLVIPEYFSAKKPVVCTRIDAVDDLIKNNENGFVVDIDDADNLAASIVNLANDNCLRETFVQNAYKKVIGKFNLTNECAEFIKFVCNLIGSRDCMDEQQISIAMESR